MYYKNQTRFESDVAYCMSVSSERRKTTILNAMKILEPLIMKTKFSTNFVVMPAHCNYMTPMIFGGHFFSEMDLAAASCVAIALRDSPLGCDSAVTHKFSGTFHKACESGDLVFIKCQLVSSRTKSLVVDVKAWREKRSSHDRELVAEAEFVFVSRKNGKFYPHGIILQQERQNEST